ncbi:hypothetical protein RN001_014749 [Aquatica leii]|uniref:Uncharacterized protein n=1 Tax=Aquatica leii TaxID=1421715 RepID=A0AAN7PYS4_9COLE|nr:hypothetical protein RN001_014749 [Aquatica leii]
MKVAHVFLVLFISVVYCIDAVPNSVSSNEQDVAAGDNEDVESSGDIAGSTNKRAIGFHNKFHKRSLGFQNKFHKSGYAIKKHIDQLRRTEVPMEKEGVIDQPLDELQQTQTDSDSEYLELIAQTQDTSNDGNSEHLQNFLPMLRRSSRKKKPVERLNL